MAGLNEFVDRLQRMKGSEVKRAILGNIRDAAHAEAVRGFVEQRDPYRKPWAPRKDRRGQWPILQKTGAGLDSLTARVAGNRVVMRIRGYFRFHQEGTADMVPRMVFPEQSQGLGTWRDPISDAARDAVRQLVEGR